MQVKIKHVQRVILRSDSVDIGVIDNGTPVSYFFTADARFTPESLASEIRDICTEFGVNFEE